MLTMTRTGFIRPSGNQYGDARRIVPIGYGYSHWPSRKRRLLGADVSVLIRVLPDNATVRYYFLAPAWEAEQAPPMLPQTTACALTPSYSRLWRRG